MVAVGPHSQSPQIDIRLGGGSDHVFKGGDFPRPFAFDARVAEVFDDMVSRSVPLYEEVTRQAALWVAHSRPRPEETQVIYDLGCSTGTTLYAIAEVISETRPMNGAPTRLIGVDNAEPMLARARDKLSPWVDKLDINLVKHDLRDLEFEGASAMVMNYTLQFLPVGDRPALLSKIADSLEPGGVLFLSEKVRSESPVIQEFSVRLYEDFKYENGYTRSEIARKKEALDSVLVPLSYDQQLDLLYTSGFAHAEAIVRWHNFACFIAIK